MQTIGKRRMAVVPAASERYSRTAPTLTSETTFALDGREIRVHPLALLFPEVPEPVFSRFVEDIEKNGQHLPAVLQVEGDQGFLLDGRHRVKACAQLEIELKFTYLRRGLNPEEFILAANVDRRHLSFPQRAYVAAKLATRQRGRPRKNAHFLALSEEQAADRLSVSRTSLQQMKAILDDEILLPVVLREVVSLSDAQVVMGTTAECKRGAIEKVVGGEARTLREAVGAPRRAGASIRPGAASARADGAHRETRGSAPGGDTASPTGGEEGAARTAAVAAGPDGTEQEETSHLDSLTLASSGSRGANDSSALRAASSGAGAGHASVAAGNGAGTAGCRSDGSDGKVQDGEVRDVAAEVRTLVARRGSVLRRGAVSIVADFSPTELCAVAGLLEELAAAVLRRLDEAAGHDSGEESPQTQSALSHLRLALARCRSGRA